MDKNKMHWIKWSKLCKSKQHGGLGFRNLNYFNEALLAKQCWRLITNDNSLIAKMYKAKYHPKCSFMEAKQSSNMSYTWRSILQARHINKGSFWMVGDGKKKKLTYRMIDGSLTNRDSRSGPLSRLIPITLLLKTSLIKTPIPGKLTR